MRPAFLLVALLLALPTTTQAQAGPGFGTCPRSFTKQDLTLPGTCPPCIANSENCQCAPDQVIGAVCLKGNQHNGIFVVRNPDARGRKGKVSARIRYKDGKPIGKHLTFHPSGRRASLFVYGVQGIEGQWREWHANGKLSGRGEFKDGSRIGESEFFYDNGKRMSVQKEDGTTIYFLDDGREFSRVISGREKPVTFVKCAKGTVRHEESFSVRCVNDKGEDVGRYARYNPSSGRKQPVEIGEYVEGKKTRVRHFKGFLFRSEYSSDARPMKY